ncbi:MAG: hypothetical protein HQM06_14015 [Magnetococcales bacterium]|nr:hypothetical protein [Magnetococcales bacterium]
MLTISKIQVFDNDTASPNIIVSTPIGNILMQSENGIVSHADEERNLEDLQKIFHECFSEEGEMNWEKMLSDPLYIQAVALAQGAYDMLTGSVEIENC